MPRYLISYISAVTGRRVWSACADKRQANREATSLAHEGAKEIRIFPYTAKGSQMNQPRNQR